VAATYQETVSVTLQFDQEIDISQLNAPEIEINDVDNNITFAGLSGPGTLIDPFTVRIDLEITGPAIGPGILLTAQPDNGIRAGGEEWAGVSALSLPFP
jgi:hypothetical protein